MHLPEVEKDVARLDRLLRPLASRPVDVSDPDPDREVVGFHCVEFVWGLGTVHCATQQEPAER
jgi:hypothetical protein